MAESGDLTRAQYYDRIRSQIEHEDELVNLRVVWQLLVQSFFFSTYATLLNANRETKSAIFEQQQTVLLWLVPSTALLAGLLTCVSVASSLLAIRRLRRLYESYAQERDDDDRSNRLFPPIQGSGPLRRLGSVSPIGLPVVFIVTWLILLASLIAASH